MHSMMKLYILIAILLHLSVSAIAQQAQQELPADQSSVDTSLTIQERIFVHLDKTVYLAGEIAWFKVYVVNGLTHRPINMSKVA
jgi:hypothetical protein